MMPIGEFEPEPRSSAFVKEKHDFLEAMMKAPIAQILRRCRREGAL